MISQKYLTFPLMLAFIILITTLAPFSTDMFLSSLPKMITDFGTTESVLNVALYGFFAALAVSILILGPVSEKYGRKIVMTASLSLYIVMSLLCSVIDDITLFLLARIFQAVGAGGAMVVSTALIKDTFSGKTRAAALTITSAIAIIGPMAAPVIGALLTAAFGWQSTFWFTCALGMVGLVFALLFTESLPKSERYTGTIAGSLGRLVVVAKNTRFMLFLGVISMFTLPYMAFLSVSAYIYEDYFGLSGTMYSLILAVNVILGLIGMIFLKCVNRHIGNRKMIYLLLATGTTGGILMLAFAHASPLLCLLCFVPCAMTNFTLRPYGFAILLNQKEGDGGAESSMLNSAVFIIGAAGMILGTLPWPDFIFGLSMCILLAAAGYALLWGILTAKGVGLKGLE
ncbi:MAG: MFS transporter [Methanocorpusculum sp.]|nr:MFS transporter [Methanocorpusculum sp.]